MLVYMCRLKDGEAFPHEIGLFLGIRCLFTQNNTYRERMDEFSAVAFDCSSMGAEQPEEDFEPIYPPVRESSPEKRLRCLALTDGTTGNGCEAGRIPAGLTARYWRKNYGYFAQNDKLAFPNILVSMMKLVKVVKITLTRIKGSHIIIYG